jgi:cell division protein FtsA
MQIRAMKSQLRLIVDIGSSVIKAAVVDIYQEMPKAILVKHTVPAQGCTRGEIKDQTLLQNSIHELLQKIDTEYLVKINQVNVLVSPADCHSLNSQGIARVLQNEVTAYDIQRVNEIVRTIPLSEDECILHTIDQQFLLDYVPYVKVPVGIRGTRLECYSHLVIVKKALVQSIEQIFKSLGISDVVIGCVGLQGLDVPESVSDNGVAVLDLGEGVSQLTVYSNSCVMLSDVLLLGVEDIIVEIDKRFQCGQTVARTLFENHASLSFVVDEDSPFIETKIAGETMIVDRAKMTELMQQGYQAIFAFVLEALKQLNGVKLDHGLYVTGGGSHMPGILEFAKKQLQTDDVEIITDQYWLMRGAAKAVLQKQVEAKSNQLFPKLKAFWQVHF